MVLATCISGNWKSMENLLHARSKVGVQDFVLLEKYTDENAFVDNLQKRFQEKLIYTYIGPVVVSVNPYEDLELYSPEVIKEYQNVNFYELPPHIFAIADTAFRSMREERKDQCILISGESGAGKTEASKKLLHYLAAASHHAPSVENVKDRLLLSNPILEAFGNAKTNRNDNSSRFGKYMDVEFDFLGAPVGGHILNYLLEKSRVVHQNQGERNFHIFYQLLSGASIELLDKLQLKKDPSAYFYLSQGFTSVSSSLNDATEFTVVTKAMDVTDFTTDEKEAVFAIVASILHLGNVGFIEEEGKAVVVNEKSIQAISLLLGCPPDVLMNAVVTKTIEAKGEQLSSPLSRDQAIYARDALAKALYERLFTWLVAKLNDSLHSVSRNSKTLMGLLDIYGFEVFERNSFEQFCINYCNEKLQQLFIELTLKSEQEEYQKEGIEWEPVAYFNNKIICDLVEERHRGIISILDEECLRPGDATDLTFLKKLENVVGKHPHFISHHTASSKLRKTINRNEFRLVHYAGDVTYNVEGFLDKNNDLLFRDLKKAMLESKNPIVMQTFKSEELSDKKRPHTAATQFKISLSLLMNILMSKEPWYIRCIKPNDSKRPGLFDKTIVAHQVKYLGLMENLRVRRAGFAYRKKYEEFLERYKCLCPATWPVYNGDPKEGVKCLVEHLKYKPDEYSLGKSKIFIRFPRTLFHTEDEFQKYKHILATIIQAKFRCYIQRKKYICIQKSARLISCYWRGHLARELLKRRRWAADVIRKFIKGFILRNEPENEYNQFFLWNVKSEFLKRLARNLPTSILDNSWPPSPASCREASQYLRKLHKSWLVHKYIKQLTPERKFQLEQKVVAEELFKGKKSIYEQSVQEPFVINRLNQEVAGRVIKVMENNLQASKDKIMYMIQVTKYDRNGHKPRPRIVVFTKEVFYLLDGKNYKLKFSVTYDKIKGLETSCYSDGFIILKLPCSNRKEKLCLDKKKFHKCSYPENHFITLYVHLRPRNGDIVWEGDLILDAKKYLVEFIVKLISVCKNKNLLSIKNKTEDVTIAYDMYGGKQGYVQFDINFNLGEVKVVHDKSGKLKVVSPPH